jgi:hypothetical protein
MKEVECGWVFLIRLVLEDTSTLRQTLSQYTGQGVK